MNKQVLISVITVCFNSSNTIVDTIESVLNQTYPNYEYIVIDGKSTDGTLEIIDSYKDKFGEKLKVVSEQDHGIYDAMNKGILISSGDIIGFINSDDWYELNALEIIANEYKKNSMQVIYGMQREYSNNVEKICYLKRHEFLPTQMIGFPATFISAEIYKRFGVYDTSYKSSADLDYLLKLYYSGQVKFIPVYKPISNFRLGGISGTNIGVIETAEIRYKYGIIKKSERNKIVFIQRCKILVKRILNRLGLRNYKI